MLGAPMLSDPSHKDAHFVLPLGHDADVHKMTIAGPRLSMLVATFSGRCAVPWW